MVSIQRNQTPLQFVVAGVTVDTMTTEAGRAGKYNPQSVAVQRSGVLTPARKPVSPKSSFGMSFDDRVVTYYSARSSLFYAIGDAASIVAVEITPIG